MPARLSPTQSKTFEIKKWLGVNQNPDGDTRLKLGEADSMQNFRITDGNSLRVRQGSQNIAGLLTAYTTTVADEAATDTTELLATTKTYSVYADVAVTDAGVFTMLGSAATMNYANHNTYTDYYYKDSLGNVKKFVDCTYDDGIVDEVQQYRYSKYSCDSSSQWRWNKYSCTESSGYRWRKYSCTTTAGYTYYGQSGLSYVTSISSGAGFTGFAFNTTTGQFSTDGYYLAISASVPGTVYTPTGSNLYISTVRSDGSGEQYVMSATGPYTVATTYSKGSTDYGYVYDEDDSAYPDGGSQLDGSTRYWYEDETNISGYVKGETDYGYVYSVNSDTYPNGSSAIVSGTRYWFENRTYTTAYSKGATFIEYVYGDTDDYPNGAQQIDGSTYYWYDSKAANTSYVWSFKAVTANTNSSDTTVRGIWSGYVGGSEYIVAACNGYLWYVTHNSVPNMLANSDFADGETSWTGWGAKAVLANGAVTFTTDGAFALYQSITVTNAHKYYVRCNAKSDGTGKVSLVLRSSADADVSNVLTTGTETDWTVKSAILTATGTGDKIAILRYTTSANLAYVDDVGIIDLTATFGAGNEPLVAWCNANLEYDVNTIEITDTTVDLWSKKSLGAVDTTGHVGMFGFSDKLYIQDGLAYRYWDGTTCAEVTGYRPLVTIAVPPTGGGTTLEQINALCGLRRVWFSPDGAEATFQLPETSLSSIDYVKIIATGAYYDIVETADEADECTASTANGTVTFNTAPTTGTNTIEIGYTAATSDSATVTAMRYNEQFSGTTDAYVFLYGDGTNTAIYSGIDYDGLPNAEYFPVLHTMAVGDENTPITSLLRHYDTLMAYKEDSAFGIRYDYITLADGVMTPAFAIQPINRGIGNIAMGQAVLVENFPRTLDGRSIYEWRTAAGGTITNDQRNAQRVSQRVERTLALMDLDSALAYYDKIEHEYYVSQGGHCVVNNTENDTWYVYTGFSATCMIVYQDEVYYGTSDGYLRHFSHDYRHDNGTAINAYWYSGSMDFGSPTKRKASARMWVSLKPETDSELTVEVDTDNSTTIATKTASAAATGEIPDIERLKLKAKKFVYYKLKLSSNSATTTATVDSVSIRVSYTADAK